MRGLATARLFECNTCLMVIIGSSSMHGEGTFSLFHWDTERLEAWIRERLFTNQVPILPNTISPILHTF
jgi:hypothetical protein